MGAAGQRRLVTRLEILAGPAAWLVSASSLTVTTVVAASAVAYR
jgi:hypothetical protein